MTTSFIPCGAKMPIVALIAGALFGGAWLGGARRPTSSAYSAIILSGRDAQEDDPRLRRRPGPLRDGASRLPRAQSAVNVLPGPPGSAAGAFIKRAGTVILLASVFIWFTSGFGWTPAQTERVTETGAPVVTLTEDGRYVAAEGVPLVFGAVPDMDASMLGKAGSTVAPIFAPLGFGNWQSTVATVMGLVAKEEVVGVFGVLYGVVDEAGEDAAAGLLEEGSSAQIETGLSPIARAFDAGSGGHGALAAFCFLVFNLLCAPCFAAMGAIKREMNSPRWTLFAISYQCVFAYVVALIVFQFGLLFSGGMFTVATGAATVLLALLIYLLARKNPYDKTILKAKVNG